MTQLTSVICTKLMQQGCADCEEPLQLSDFVLILKREDMNFQAFSISSVINVETLTTLSVVKDNMM